MGISFIIPNDSYCYLILLILIYKPFIIGPVLFLLFLRKCKVHLNILDTLLIFMLICQVGMLIDIIINSFINYGSDINIILAMSDNNSGDNIPRGNNDPARLIRYLTTNIAALALRRPMNRVIASTVVNISNVFIDVISNEEKANYWIDQYNFYVVNGRFRGGKPGSGPLGTEFFEETDKIVKPSNYLPDLNFIKDFFSPVEHSISLDQLQNIHIVMNFGLFVLVFCVVLLLIYFFFNLLILFNKDFLLNKVKNKYAVLYIKYVLFKSRIDILVIGIFIIGTLCFILYILHYLIVHPILINT